MESSPLSRFTSSSTSCSLAIRRSRSSRIFLVGVTSVAEHVRPWRVPPDVAERFHYQIQIIRFALERYFSFGARP
jgi:hypothetical protein